MSLAAQGSSVRDQLLDVAEALFLEHGVDGVSLRAIVRASGQKNQSALQYHFGGRDGLIGALLMRRARAIEARRRPLLEEALKSAHTLDLRTSCAVLMRAPFLLCREQPGFKRFLGRFGQHLLTSEHSAPLSAENRQLASRHSLHGMIAAALDQLDPELRALRMEHAYDFGLLALSRRARSGKPFRGAAAELFFNNLVDQVAGLLCAPVSAETAAHLSPHHTNRCHTNRSKAYGS